ncbi:hypothetical protein [Rhizobacter fulvus]|jgi:hypothetical protein
MKGFVQDIEGLANHTRADAEADTDTGHLDVKFSEYVPGRCSLRGPKC